jgi:uncharacterized protein (DUF488 family)
MKAAKKVLPRIMTIGHSTRPISEFIEILKTYKIKLLVDVRKIPKSRHNPQYGNTRLQKSLNLNNIAYFHMEGLAGRRRTQKETKNGAWRNASFRGYADYMQTEEFKKALTKLISLSKRRRLVIMCAEAVPWRCHRSLIADSLLAQKIPVDDIFSKTNARPHKLPDFAKVRRKQVSYPAKN